MDVIKVGGLRLQMSIVFEGSADGPVVARFRRLGLRAYGKTQEEAKNTLHKMLHVFIDEHSKTGQIDHVLNDAKIFWYTEVGRLA